MTDQIKTTIARCLIAKEAQCLKHIAHRNMSGSSDTWIKSLGDVREALAALDMDEWITIYKSNLKEIV